jgi:AraC-like DNA-binding protein
MSLSCSSDPSDGTQTTARRLPAQSQVFERPPAQEMAASLGPVDFNSSVCCLAHGIAWQPGRCHYHEGYELHLLVEPHRCAYVGGEFHWLAARSVVLIGPRLPHNLAFIDVPVDAKVRSLTLRFAGEPLRKGMTFLPELRETEVLMELAYRGVEFSGLDHAVVSRFQRIMNLRGLDRFSEFAALLHELARWPAWRTLASMNEEDVGRAPIDRARRVHRALDFINANYTEALTLSEVSAVAMMPASSFSRCFRQITGSGLTERVIALRIAKACQLLLHTRKHVGSICQDVGFHNLSNFNRHFRSLRGVSPGEYRMSGGAMEFAR